MTAQKRHYRKLSEFTWAYSPLPFLLSVATLAMLNKAGRTLYIPMDYPRFARLPAALREAKPSLRIRSAV